MILQLVTDRRQLSSGRNDVACTIRQVAYAVEAGVDVVQIRERDLESAALAALVRAAIDVARGTTTRVVVNDRLDVALVCGAAGVHLRGDSIHAADARRLAPAGFLVGLSVHAPADAIAAAAHVDYLVAGTVWRSASKSVGQPMLGAEGLAEIVRSVRVPVLGIGGVTLDRLPALAACGAAGGAAIGLFQNHSQSAGCRAAPLKELVVDARRLFDAARLGGEYHLAPR